MLSFVTDHLLSLFYPQRCGACGRLVEKVGFGVACRECWRSTALFDASDALCPKCGLLLAAAAARSFSTCKDCDKHDYDIARAAGVYEKALAASVLHLKRTPNVPAAVRTGLINAFDRAELPNELTLVPVPLSKQRLIERGFNQASLLARVIARHSGLPVDEYSLVRNHDTPMHRAAMDRKAREATVKNAFSVVRPNLIKGRNILLVDDVMTSGATASYCAKALKKGGAGRVYVLTLARAAKE
ncbi:MAG: ComF family protein [Pyrinomonadaceae bacterium]